MIGSGAVVTRDIPPYAVAVGIPARVIRYRFDPETIENHAGMHDATGAGRGYAVSGGVASAIEKCIDEYYPGTEVKIQHAEGLAECKKMLTLCKAGKLNGYMIEGMGCPGGCVAGAGTMQPIKKSQGAVNLYASKAGHANSNETEYVKELNKLVE